jgi:hypothetical protein
MYQLQIHFDDDSGIEAAAFEEVQHFADRIGSRTRPMSPSLPSSATPTELASWWSLKSISRDVFRYRHLINRYHQRGGRRGWRVTNSANRKPIALAINIEPSGLSCTFFAIACEPSRKVSPGLS